MNFFLSLLKECLKWYKLLTKSCHSVDLDYLNSYDGLSNIRGTTCVLTLIIGDRLFCMNVGDSRAIMSRNKTAVLLSRDHKPVSQLHPD